ncbi:hypothetical protein F4805DRAFT_384639 [Annulohypoxylon moriforme]|nr:hypothetical protein F4805DRAFT_384639 [Annulohypoxylon moriforme]
MALYAAAVRQPCLGAGTPKRPCTSTAQLVFSALKKGGRQWARSPLQRGVPCATGTRLAGSRSTGLSALFVQIAGGVLFVSKKNDNGPGNAGGQVFAHGVTRRRIKH